MGRYQKLTDIYQNESKKYEEYKEACIYAIESIYAGLLKYFEEDTNIILKTKHLYRNDDGSFFRNFELLSISKTPLTCMITIKHKGYTTYSATIGTKLGISKSHDFEFKKDIEHIINQNDYLYQFLYRNLLESIPEHIAELVET